MKMLQASQAEQDTTFVHAGYGSASSFPGNDMYGPVIMSVFPYMMVMLAAYWAVFLCFRNSKRPRDFRWAVVLVISILILVAMLVPSCMDPHVERVSLDFFQ